MATASIQNVIKNSQVTENASGLEIKETWLVDGLDASARSPLIDSLNSLGLPQYGDPHPASTTAVVTSRIPRNYQNSRTQCLVDLTWMRSAGSFNPTDPPRVRFTAFTREYQTNFDSDGNKIIVKYTDANGKPAADQIGQVHAYRAMGTLEIDFVRSSDPSYLLNYFGRLNSSSWRGGAANTWFFQDLGIEKQAYQPYWNIHTAFVYDPDTHNRTAAYIGGDGRVPKDIDKFDPTKPQGTKHFGWTNAYTEKSANFIALGLPSGF